MNIRYRSKEELAELVVALIKGYTLQTNEPNIDSERFNKVINQLLDEKLDEFIRTRFNKLEIPELMSLLKVFNEPKQR